ncbi:MAG TPA: haloalkane dehalogenase [Thermoleophilaceae bacterium]|nr:haloalkane dehalogenase [Thermoleophilaceae bacterium]
MDVFRTPEDRFAGLVDFPYEPRYRDHEGLRLAHVDEGDGPPVVMLHGQPTWGYLFRRLIPPLLESGYRCVVPDLPGFGRSDKPLDQSWYSIARHVDALGALLDELDLQDVTLVMHDWGGPLGLRLAAVEMPERIARLAVMDSVLTGDEELGDFWRGFRDIVMDRPLIPTGRIVRMGCADRPSREVTRAYDAPFPAGSSQAGVRAFPDLIPFTPDAPGADLIRDTIDGLRGDTRPALTMWADSDPIFPRERFAGQLREILPRGGEPLTVERAGHFLQEDRGDWIGRLIADWLAAVTPARAAAPRAPA